MRWPNGLPKALTLSYDDGVDTDYRLIEIMKKHNIKGTFNINSGLYAKEDAVREPNQIHFRVSKSEVSRLYNNEFCEVACHTVDHCFLDLVSSEEATYQVLMDRRNLEKQFGYQIRGMAYPFGTYNEKVIDILKFCGISYCRTVNSTLSFDIPKNWLVLDPTCHHNHEKLNELKDKFLNTEASKIKTPFLFYLWGHSYEFRRDNNWELIEHFCEEVSNKDDIWYATNIEIYNYVKAFEQLQFSADFMSVYNPTATDLWLIFNDNKNVTKIPAGKTVKF